MRRDLHCSLDRRAWTDPVTNATVLSGAEFLKSLGNFIVPGTLPSSCLASFLHEAVHHWCFSSPVGTALALLQFRARRNGIVFAAEERKFNILDIIDDVYKYEAAIESFR